MAIATEGSDLLLGTAQGMHVSHDGGATWSRVAGMPRSTRVRQIFVDPHQPGHWYVNAQTTQTGYRPDGSFYAAAIYDRLESRDSGANWQRISIFHPDLGGGPAIHPAAGKALFWFNYYSWYHSADNGATWQYHADGSWGSITSALGLPLPGAPFGLLTYDEVTPGYKARLTTNDGAGWSAPVATIPAPAGIYQTPALSRVANAPTRAYWQFSGNVAPSTIGTVDFVTGAVVTFPPLDGRVVRVFEDPTAPGTTLGLSKPDNDGPCDGCVRYELASLAPGATQWTLRAPVDVGQKFTGADQPALLPGAGSRLWVADPSLGLRLSNDAGQNWTTSNSGLPEALVNAVLIDPRNPAHLLAARDMQSLQRSVDGGATWADVGGDLPPDVRSLARSPVDPDHVVATAKDGFYRSSDGGANWQHVQNAAQPAGMPGWANVAWCANDDGSLLANRGQHVYRSSDGGTSWTLVRSFAYRRLSIESARLSPGRVYVSDQTNATWRTADCGATFTQLAGVPVVAVDPRDDAHLVSVFNSPHDGLFYRVSVNAGDDWTHTQNAAVIDASTGAFGWIDACNPSRFTDSRLTTMSGTAQGMPPEEPGTRSWLSGLRAFDSRCNGTISYNVVANDAGGIWVSVADLDRIFRSGFDP